MDKDLFKEVKVINMENTNKSEYLKFCIIATGFTSRHIFRSSNCLKKELESHFGDKFKIRLIGTK